MTLLDPDAFLRQTNLVICCGSGGVGKTTTAAALGVRAASLGRNVLVMTIDPARRLAQALGLNDLSHEPQPVALEAPGALAAMMLDPKSAFDALVRKHAPSPAARDAILSNRYYQQLAENFGGSRELISMEQVLEYATADPERLLIVDTPPAQHALDFLDAPRRVLGLLDGSLTDAILKPYQSIARAQFQFFRQSSAMTLKFVERITGANLITELGEFLNAFSVLFDGFRERAEAVRGLMARQSTGFLLVCAPEPMSLREVNRFAARLNAEPLRSLGVLVNRASPATVQAV
ncbi:MAG: ArsA-related P-loop ATPase, partial [Pseudomonadota bacterium]